MLDVKPGVTASVAIFLLSKLTDEQKRQALKEFKHAEVDHIYSKDIDNAIKKSRSEAGKAKKTRKRNPRSSSA